MNNNALIKKDFRTDINGLRAIAVISVVFFHFNPTWLPGGFIGVDIFFVISGYLMTNIISKGLSSNNFSYNKFYLARINRIYPALLMLCAALLFWGWFKFPTTEFELLLTHISSSITFISNITYWQESGYFELASKEKWLTHTWSLSVEWQFYILYPIVLGVLYKLSKHSKIPILLFISSLILYLFAIIASAKYPDASYYLLPTRAFEMLAGGVTFLYQNKSHQYNKKIKRIIEVIGWALIVISLCIINESDFSWPGSAAILPVVGTSLIIWANNQNNILLNNTFSSHLGKWSYSIYLWHWPVSVYAYNEANGEIYNLFYIVLSCLLGAISYYLIEMRKYPTNVLLYKPTFLKHPPIAACLIIIMSCIIFKFFSADITPVRLGAQSEKAKYLDYWPNEYRKTQLENKKYTQQCNYFDVDDNKAKETIDPSCTNKGMGGIFVWGDSHAQNLSTGLKKIYSEKLNYHQIATSSCPPMIEDNNKLLGEFKIACARATKAAKNAIININPEIIIMAQQKKHDQNDYFQILKFINDNKLRSKLILIGSTPQWHPSLPKAIAKRHFDKKIKMIKDAYFDKEIFTINATLTKRYANSPIFYISLIDHLCKNEFCLAKVDDNNMPLVSDYGHLTEKASIILSEDLIKPHIDKILFKKE